jgi:hypothetical protein
MAGAAAAAAPEALATRGLSALARFEKAGLIKKVIPLSRKAEGAAVRGSLRALAAIARSVHDTPERNPHAGASIIELEGDAQVEELRTALADDPTSYAAVCRSLFACSSQAIIIAVTPQRSYVAE